MDSKVLKPKKRESKINFEVLFRLANEYQQHALNILQPTDESKQLSRSFLTEDDANQFYILINQAIKLYIIILEKHNENKDKNFFLSNKKEILITLRLLDLLVNYTLNHKLATNLAYKLLLKLSNSSNNDIKNEIYQLQFYYVYMIPMSISPMDDSINKKSLSNLDILLYKRDDIDRDWMICFHLCKMNYFFKVKSFSVEIESSFNYFKEIEHYLRSEKSEVFFYVKLCEICYHFGNNAFDKASVLFEECSFETCLHDDMMKLAFYLLQIYVALVKEDRFVTIVKKISKILAVNKEIYASEFTINLNINNLTLKCTLLQYNILKKLLLFLQGLSKIQTNYSKDEENYYEIFVQKLLNSSLNPIQRVSVNTQKTLNSINNSIIEYSKFYQSWQKQILFQEAPEGTRVSKDLDLDFYNAYFDLLLQKPNKETVLKFMEKNSQALKLKKFKDVDIYLKLYLYCLVHIDEENIDSHKSMKIDLPEYPVENKIFEATKLMIQLLCKMDTFHNSKTVTSSLYLMDQESLVNNLQKTLSPLGDKKDHNKVFFLEIVLLIIQTLLNDNNKDSFDKFYTLISEIENRKMNYILPTSLYQKLIKATITLGLKQEEPLARLLFLQKLAT